MGGPPELARPSKQLQSKPLRLGLGLCAAQAVCGQALSLFAIVYLDGATAALGLLLGILITVNACLGVSGCVFRDINQLAGHVVAGVLCLCLVLSYIAQVASMARTDCALAELTLMDERANAALQQLTESRGHLLSAVHLRLEAMDKTMDLLSTDCQLLPGSSAPAAAAGQTAGQGAAELQRAHARELWRASDQRFVEQKLSQLRDHGLKVVVKLFKERTQGKLAALQGTVTDRLTEQDREEMERRFSVLFQTIGDVLHSLNQHLAGEEALSGPAYEALLGRLEQAMQAASAYIREVDQVLGREGVPLTHSEFQRLLAGLEANDTSSAPAAGSLLGGAREDTQLLKDALGRQQRPGGYETVEVRDPARVKAGWRQQWNALLAAAQGAGEGRHAGSMGLLEQLPAQCMQEQRAERTLVRAALALVCMQAACIWAILSAAVHQAQKLRQE
ncbi:diguanylate cyclase (GGDEF) domain-containing [Chlorella sorokiniana]|uniref:Diguanylate cyclase (GGDEF) domain-containing n=1 Tax=Chlorella sorokiniana TaxID=3076 RepID=A0A2P6TMN3_CHLSO|nr:diguanylate cyclase (GGDEF) domain-containing [Chlorella sorokiniana]|eukprot:PRW45592.1 diguanylate cyclase (GGDEF) domain-containing [Chlorella sorokiniana]